VTQHVFTLVSCTDPFHVNCQRIISVDGTKASLKGTDGNPACPADGSGTAWTLTGKVDGKDIFVDFTPKGGPKDLKGVFDGTGINWPDGKYHAHTYCVIFATFFVLFPRGCSVFNISLNLGPINRKQMDLEGKLESSEMCNAETETATA